MEIKKRRRKFSLQRVLITIVTLMLSLLSSAQVKLPSSDATIYLLPNGKTFNIQKLDSLNAAWGEDRVLFQHNEEDDKNNIMRLVRLTDEMKQQMENRKNLLSGMTNQAARDFRLTDSTGKQWHLSELKGKIVVLNFWFTSCAPCIQEMPELNRLAKEYKDKEVVFLGLTFNNQVQVDKFLKNRKFEYTILSNSKEVDKQYKVTSWPTSMVIDTNGTIKFITNSSPKIHEDLKAVIDSLLKS